jgi:hypothetical protein
MQNPKTTTLGYLTSAIGVLAAIADVLPGKYAMYCLIAGQVLSGVANILAKDGGH